MVKQILMDQAIVKTSIFIPHAERAWDEGYGSISAFHCELLDPISNKGACHFKPEIQFCSTEWQQAINKISVLIEPRHRLLCKALPQDGLEKRVILCSLLNRVTMTRQCCNLY